MYYKIYIEFFIEPSVVNDSAGRGNDFIEKYKNYLTTNEVQLKYLLELVEGHSRI